MTIRSRSRAALAAAVLASLAVAGPALAEVNQGGRFNVQAKTSDPTFTNQTAASVNVMMTVCVDAGGGPSVQVNLVQGNSLKSTVLLAAAGICRTAVFTVTAGEVAMLTAPVNAASGTYQVSSPVR